MLLHHANCQLIQPGPFYKLALPLPQPLLLSSYIFFTLLSPLLLTNFDFSMEPDEKNEKVPNRKITMADETGMVQTRKRNRKNTKVTERTDDLDADGDDDSAEIERRVEALQRLVPGGENMEVEALFEETADYIEELRGQVMMMRSLADVIDAVTKKKRLARR